MALLARALSADRRVARLETRRGDVRGLCEIMITVWGRADSSATARVMWALGEVGAAWARKDWGGAYGGNDDPAFRAISPAGRIPAITLEDGFSLWESGAIIGWLADHHPVAGLWPTGRERWRAQAWMDWSTAAGRAVGAVRTAYRREHPDLDDIVRTLQDAALVLQPAEQRLADRDYLMGERLTVADLALGVIVHRWFRVPDALPAPPMENLLAWYRRLSLRPAYAEHVLARVSVRPQRLGGG